MKPALIPSSYPPHVGGVENVCSRLAGELLSRGFQPTIITNRWPKSLPKHERSADIDVYRFAFRVPGPSVRHNLGWAIGAVATGTDVKRIVRRTGSDLVNLHCVSSNTRYAVNAARHLGLPFVLSIHGELTGDETSVFNRSRRLRKSLWDAAQRAARITAPSSYALHELQEWLNDDLSARSEVIPNGVDSYIGAKDHAERSRVVFGAGRLVTTKGFDILIKGFAEACRGSDYRLVIAGDGPERAQLERLAESVGIRSQVRLLGFIAWEEVRRFMSCAQIVVVPSRAEAQGLSLLEGLAAGAAVVASAVGGIPETAQHRSQALLFPPGDSGALAKCLGRLVSSPDLRRDLGLAGRQRAAEFSWAATVDAYEACYRSVH